MDIIFIDLIQKFIYYYNKTLINFKTKVHMNINETKLIDLPIEVLAEVFKYSCEKDINNVSLLNKTFNDIVLQISPFKNIMDIAFKNKLSKLSINTLSSFETPKLNTVVSLYLTPFEKYRIAKKIDTQSSLQFLSLNNDINHKIANSIIQRTEWKLEDLCHEANLKIASLSHLTELCNKILVINDTGSKNVDITVMNKINNDELLATALLRTTFKNKQLVNCLKPDSFGLDYTSKISAMIGNHKEIFITRFGNSSFITKDADLILQNLQIGKFDYRTVHIPDNFFQDIDFVYSYLESTKNLITSNIQYHVRDIVKNHKEDKEIVLQAVKKCELSLDYAANCLKKDKEFIMSAVKINGQVLKYADKSLLEYREIVLSAIKNAGSLGPGLILDLLDRSFKEDAVFFLQCYQANPQSYYRFSKKLFKDETIMTQAVKININALDFCDDKLLQKKEFLKKALLNPQGKMYLNNYKGLLNRHVGQFHRDNMHYFGSNSTNLVRPSTKVMENPLKKTRFEK